MPLRRASLLLIATACGLSAGDSDSPWFPGFSLQLVLPQGDLKTLSGKSATLGLGGELGFQVSRTFSLRGRLEGIMPMKREDTVHGGNYLQTTEQKVGEFRVGVDGAWRPAGPEGTFELMVGGYARQIKDEHSVSIYPILPGPVPPSSGQSETHSVSALSLGFALHMNRESRFEVRWLSGSLGRDGLKADLITAGFGFTWN